jgi:hypothetical protein
VGGGVARGGRGIVHDDGSGSGPVGVDTGVHADADADVGVDVDVDVDVDNGVRCPQLALAHSGGAGAGGETNKAFGDIIRRGAALALVDAHVGSLDFSVSSSQVEMINRLITLPDEPHSTRGAAVGDGGAAKPTETAADGTTRRGGTSGGAVGQPGAAGAAAAGAAGVATGGSTAAGAVARGAAPTMRSPSNGGAGVGAKGAAVDELAADAAAGATAASGGGSDGGGGGSASKGWVAWAWGAMTGGDDAEKEEEEEDDDAVDAVTGGAVKKDMVTVINACIAGVSLTLYRRERVADSTRRKSLFELDGGDDSSVGEGGVQTIQVPVANVGFVAVAVTPTQGDKDKHGCVALAEALVHAGSRLTRCGRLVSSRVVSCRVLLQTHGGAAADRHQRRGVHAPDSHSRHARVSPVVVGVDVVASVAVVDVAVVRVVIVVAVATAAAGTGCICGRGSTLCRYASAGVSCRRRPRRRRDVGTRRRHR